MSILRTEFCEAAQEEDFDIRLMCQPPNSPDLNILDLGFFRALQCLRYKVTVKSVDDFTAAVEETFKRYLVKQLDHIFLILRLCMRETMKVKGDNTYKNPSYRQKYSRKRRKIT